MGDVVVRTWNRDAVRVQSNRSGRSVLQVVVRNQIVVLDYSRGPVGGRDRADRYRRGSVCAWPELTVSSTSTVSMARSLLTASRVAIVLKNVGGAVKATTVDGSNHVRKQPRAADLSTVEDDIVVSNAAGDVQAESVDGDIVLTGIRSQMVDVATIDGDIKFAGAWLPNGRYSLTTHDGDIWLVVPDNANATLAARLFDNPDIDSTVPLPKAGPSRGRRRTFTFGAGAAQIEVETFDGDLKLRRAGELPVARERAAAPRGSWRGRPSR